MKRRLPLILGVLAVAAVCASGYLASFCVLLENECHLHHRGSCERLGLYLWGAAAMMAFALITTISSVWTYAVARRKALRR